jgi:hypothetical protein
MFNVVLMHIVMLHTYVSVKALRLSTARDPLSTDPAPALDVPGAPDSLLTVTPLALATPSDPFGFQSFRPPGSSELIGLRCPTLV